MVFIICLFVIVLMGMQRNRGWLVCNDMWCSSFVCVGILSFRPMWFYLSLPMWMWLWRSGPPDGGCFTCVVPKCGVSLLVL